MKMPWILKPGNLLLVGGLQIKEMLINTILEIMEQREFVLHDNRQNG